MFAPYDSSAVKKLTITIDEEMVRWAKLEAARKGTSVSRLLGEVLNEKMLRDRGYESARVRYLHREPTGLKKIGSQYPKRNEIHER
jgi:hypothetical protein